MHSMSGRRLAVVVSVEQHDDPVLRRFAVPAADVPAFVDVLGDPALGGFEAAYLRDPGAREAYARVRSLFEGRDQEDCVLVYFRGVMLTGPGGGLYLAAADTVMGRPADTAVDVAQIAALMQHSRAGQAVVLLDGRTGGPVDAGHHFRAARSAEWQSRVVIAATARPEPPTFAGLIAEGVSGGAADRDRDGWIGISELHDHLRERDPSVRQWVFGSGRQPWLARVRRAGSDQMASIAQLATAAAGPDLSRAVEAREALRRMTAGEGRVAAAAAAALRRTSVRIAEPALDFGRVAPGTGRLAAEIAVQGPPLAAASAVSASAEGLHARLEGNLLRVSWFPTVGRLDGTITLDGPAGTARLTVTGEVSDEFDAVTGGRTPSAKGNGAAALPPGPPAAGPGAPSGGPGSPAVGPGSPAVAPGSPAGNPGSPPARSPGSPAGWDPAWAASGEHGLAWPGETAWPGEQPIDPWPGESGNAAWPNEAAAGWHDAARQIPPQDTTGHPPVPAGGQDSHQPHSFGTPEAVPPSSGGPGTVPHTGPRQVPLPGVSPNSPGTGSPHAPEPHTSVSGTPSGSTDARRHTPPDRSPHAAADGSSAAGAAGSGDGPGSGTRAPASGPPSGSGSSRPSPWAPISGPPAAGLWSHRPSGHPALGAAAGSGSASEPEPISGSASGPGSAEGSGSASGTGSVPGQGWGSGSDSASGSEVGPVGLTAGAAPAAEDAALVAPKATVRGSFPMATPPEIPTVLRDPVPPADSVDNGPAASATAVGDRPAEAASPQESPASPPPADTDLREMSTPAAESIRARDDLDSVRSTAGGADEPETTPEVVPATAWPQPAVGTTTDDSSGFSSEAAHTPSSEDRQEDDRTEHHLAEDHRAGGAGSAELDEAAAPARDESSGPSDARPESTDAQSEPVPGGFTGRWGIITAAGNAEQPGDQEKNHATAGAPTDTEPTSTGHAASVKGPATGTDPADSTNTPLHMRHETGANSADSQKGAVSAEPGTGAGSVDARDSESAADATNGSSSAGTAAGSAAAGSAAAGSAAAWPGGSTGTWGRSDPDGVWPAAGRKPGRSMAEVEGGYLPTGAASDDQGAAGQAKAEDTSATGRRPDAATDRAPAYGGPPGDGASAGWESAGAGPGESDRGGSDRGGSDRAQGGGSSAGAPGNGVTIPAPRQPVDEGSSWPTSPAQAVPAGAEESGFTGAGVTAAHAWGGSGQQHAGGSGQHPGNAGQRTDDPGQGADDAGLHGDGAGQRAGDAGHVGGPGQRAGDAGHVGDTGQYADDAGQRVSNAGHVGDPGQRAGSPAGPWGTSPANVEGRAGGHDAAGTQSGGSWPTSPAAAWPGTDTWATGPGAAYGPGMTYGPGTTHPGPSGTESGHPGTGAEQTGTDTAGPGAGRAGTRAGRPGTGQSPRAAYPVGYQGDYPATPADPGNGWDAGPGAGTAIGTGYPPGTGGTGYPPGTGGTGYPPGTGGTGYPPGTGGTGYSPGAGGSPYPEEKKPRRRGALIAAAVVVLALLGGGAYVGVRYTLAANEPEASGQRTAPAQTQEAPEQPGGEASVPATDPAGTAEPPPVSLAKPVVVDRVSLGREPEGVAVSPDNKTIYVADQASKDVHVVDVASKKVSVVKVPNTPRFLALSADGSRLYVSLFEENFTGNGLAVIDTTNRTLVKTIRTGPRPFEPAVAPDGQVWVPIHNGARVEIYDDQTLTEAARISVPPNPHWIVFTPDGKTAFTANHESSQISVVNVADGLVRKNFKVGRSPHALAVTPDGKKLVVTNYDLDTVEVYDTGDQRQLNKVAVGREPQAVMISSDGRHAYVVNEGSDNLSVIDLGTGKVVSTVAVGDSPRVNALSPDGRRLYVTDGRGKTVTVLRTTEE
jgi:YVTN family beta-propeller protein